MLVRCAQSHQGRSEQLVGIRYYREPQTNHHAPYHYGLEHSSFRVHGIVPAALGWYHLMLRRGRQSQSAVIYVQ